MQGRAEVIRLTLAVCGLEWKEAYVTDEAEVETKKKAGTEEAPFGQWPMLSEDGKILCQTHAIIKHLGRHHGLYGRNKNEDYLIDSFMIGADSLRQQFSDLHWSHGNTPEAREKFEKEHLSPESKIGKCKGAHLAYLEGFLERSETDWIAGGKKLSIADIVLFDLYDGISHDFGADKLAQLYPKCSEHTKKVSEVEEIAEYMKSEKRHKSVT